jgi:predicted extracellular nuclease
VGPGARIRDIQGRGHRSPLEGEQVEDVPGIVTAVGKNGFWIQDPDPDDDSGTSEGIFVFTKNPPRVGSGDEIRVSGQVTEFRPGDEPGNTTITELTNVTFRIVTSGNERPAPTILGVGGRIPPKSVIDDDASGDVGRSGSFDADEDGIDFFESLEGMRVQINEALVVGPTNGYGETWVVGDGGAHATELTPRGGIYIREDDYNPERIQLEDTLYKGNWPRLNVGARLTSPVDGVMHYGYGNYELYVTEPLAANLDGEVIPERTLLLGTPEQLTVATLNVENLGGDAPKSEFATRAAIIADNLASPDMIVLEEMQDNNGIDSGGGTSASQTFERLISAIEDAGGPSYAYAQIDPTSGADGGQPGGNIRVGFLYNPDRVRLEPRPGGDARTDTRVLCQAGQATLDPNPGRVDPRNPAFGDSRKPLAGQFTFGGQTIYVIGVHFSSKGGDEPLFGRRQPPARHSERARIEQAQAVNDFVDQILACDPGAVIVVLGDVNDFQFSSAVAALQGGVLYNLMETLPPNERYSYIYEGNSQVLDQILVSKAAFDELSPEYDVVHVNAEFKHGTQVSDHDPAVVRLDLK